MILKEVAAFAQAARIVVLLGVSTLGGKFASFAFVVVALLAHTLGIVLIISMRALCN